MSVDTVIPIDDETVNSVVAVTLLGVVNEGILFEINSIPEQLTFLFHSQMFIDLRKCKKLDRLHRESFIAFAGFLLRHKSEKKISSSACPLSEGIIRRMWDRMHVYASPLITRGAH